MNGQTASPTSEELTSYYLSRIEAQNEQDQTLRAITWTNPDALSIARIRDKAETPGVLQGVPFVVKDNVDVRGAPSAGGFAPLAAARPGSNAVLVDRLLEAGGVLIGKANMSELALSNGRLGYSSTLGTTKNPFNLRRNASGSSSGSAAAVRAQFAAFAIGTDTAGSIRAPAAVTGLVGFKPTSDTVPTQGIIPLSPTLDVAGPIAPRVADAARVFSVLRGDSPAQTEALLDAVTAQTVSSDVRIVALRGFEGIHPGVESETAQATRRLARSVAVTRAPAQTLFEASAWPVLEEIINLEFGSALDRYLGRLAEGPGSLRELLQRIDEQDFSAVNPARIEQLELAASRAGTAQRAQDVAATRDAIEDARERTMQLLADQDADFVVFPTMLCPASALYGEEDASYLCDAQDPYLTSYLANLTGFPEITVPVGMTQEGLPVGLSILGPAGSDDRLLAAAYMLEQAVEFSNYPLSLR